MSKKRIIPETTEEKIKLIAPLRPIDDIFFEVLATDKLVCQEIIRTILQDDKIIVEEVIVQDSLKNIYGRSVRLDALCILDNGTRCNVEVQRSDNDDHLKRARFNASSITVKDSVVSEKFESVKDVIIIYISQFDFLGKGLCTYHIDKVIRETGDIIDDGLSEIFVNTAIDDKSDIAELMKCFLQPKVNNPKFPELTRKTEEIKETGRGASTMCKFMEKYMEESKAEGKAEGKIEATIKTAKKFSIADDAIIKTLMEECNLSETEAKEELQNYSVHQ
jgi:predicted transposase/invertase (TIGR01784 family)